MKPLFIIEDHKVIADYVKELDQKEKFYQKQHDDLHAKIKAEKDKFWNEVYDYMKINKIKFHPKSPKYIKSGVVYELTDDDKGDVLETLVEFFGKK